LRLLKSLSIDPEMIPGGEIFPGSWAREALNVAAAARPASKVLRVKWESARVEFLGEDLLFDLRSPPWERRNSAPRCRFRRAIEG
jgi:hypothetical protein